jgi:nucleoside-diphosphate-sugar epimerase
MTNVLMLAGAGWLGHHIANALSKHGAKVTVVHLSMDEKFVPQMSKEISHILGDTRDESLCSRAIDQVQPDVVIDVRPNPDLIERNYRMLKGRIGHYLHCSSAGVYVPTGKIPVDENAQTYAIERFGDAFIAKKRSDEQAMALHNMKCFPVTIIRPAVILGTGMMPLELWGLRNAAFFKQLKDGKVLQVSEKNDVVMSAVNVEDVTEIFTQAVLHPEKSKGEIFNASSWIFTHKEYLAVIGQALGITPKVEYVSTEMIIKSHTSDPAFSRPDYEFLMSDLAVSGKKAQDALSVRPRQSLVEVLKNCLSSL